MRIRCLLLTVIGVALWQGPVEAQTPPDLQIVTDGVPQNTYGVGLYPDSTLWMVSRNADSNLQIISPGNANGNASSAYLAPFGPKAGVDMSGYRALVIEMKGDAGSYVSVGIKDATQPDYGHETKILISLSPSLQQYYFPLNWFIGADPRQIYVAAEFVFTSPKSQILEVRSIRYTGQGYAPTAIFPVVIFGGGWSTSLYFTNTGSQSTQFPVNFVGTDGNPLNVPSSFGSSTVTGVTVTLPPRATTIFQLPNQASLIQGYATMSLPPNVTGYAMLDQSIQGQPNQQAIEPLSGVAKTSQFIWDETASAITTVAVVNIDAVDATISITVYNDTGHELGTATVSVPALTKQSFVLRNLSGLSGIVGQRGSAEFTISTGNLGVLALRYVGAAFSAIPMVKQ